MTTRIIKGEVITFQSFFEGHHRFSSSFTACVVCAGGRFFRPFRCAESAEAMANGTEMRQNPMTLSIPSRATFAMQAQPLDKLSPDLTAINKRGFLSCYIDESGGPLLRGTPVGSNSNYAQFQVGTKRSIGPFPEIGKIHASGLCG